MMLSGQNHRFHSTSLEGLHPLLAVQFNRIESRSWCVAIAPFQVIEGIQAKMHKGISSKLLPFKLLPIRYGIAWLRCTLARQQNRACQNCSQKSIFHVANVAKTMVCKTFQLIFVQLPKQSGKSIYLPQIFTTKFNQYEKSIYPYRNVHSFLRNGTILLSYRHFR